ncbi:MAG: glycosyl transferase family 36 [Elusimicrobia bacterium]|nr:glycosyl transferase family 36 [Elusimicrobiota bacterium]MBP9698932.1 glycosyl transferase family 36 [Elusimicrobiota bacterium]
MSKGQFPFKTAYGHFSDDGASYLIQRPDTPRPWINVMSSGTYGVALSQSGSGYSWLHNASMNRITRWNQDLIRDDWGRFLYVRDDESGKYWSVGWQPVQMKPESYEVIHGVGYTIINSQYEGIQAQWLVFVPHDEPLEVWRLRIKNTTRRPRKISLWSYLEWNLGESPDSHREFHRTFIETSVQDKNNIILAKKRLSPLKNAKGQSWNRNWDHVAWHAVSLPAKAVSCDKQAFLGNYGSLRAPACLEKGAYVGTTTHKWDDSIASFQVPLTLKAGEERSLLWSVGAADSQSQALVKARRFMDFSQVDSAWGRTESFWDKYMTSFTVKTPDRSFDALTNTWLKYQALSGRLWGRTAYYQTGGAYGFRDQLQDSQVFLPLDAEGTRKQIHLHAAHQFSDGTVYHWWHPLSEEGHPSGYSDDLLWLPFVISNYIKETAHWGLLNETVPFAVRPGVSGRKESGTIHDHAVRAIEKSLTRISPRGLPLMGEADWNDGLSGAGRGGKGESVWMAHFLVGILNDWADLTERAVAANALLGTEKKRAVRYRRSADKLKAAVNRTAWDGAWFWRATTDDGTVLGSKKSKEGKIFLNAQTWALLNGVVSTPARKKAILNSLEKHLYSSHGPLLLTPAYTTPDERIGYLSRYSPTTRENGGVYTHAAVWALQMECALGRAEKAWDIYEKICPILASAKNPDRYRAEPYVTPGNVDGPGSPTPGRAGWTWYTGSAAWLYRVSTEWILGIRPVWDGLLIRPCLPPHWKKVEAARNFRGGAYRIVMERDASLPAGTQKITFNNRELSGDVLPVSPGMQNTVQVRLGPVRR